MFGYMSDMPTVTMTPIVLSKLFWPLSSIFHSAKKLTGLPLSRTRLSILSDMSHHLSPMVHQLTTHQRKNRVSSYKIMRVPWRSRALSLSRLYRDAPWALIRGHFTSSDSSYRTKFVKHKVSHDSNSMSLIYTILKCDLNSSVFLSPKEVKRKMK